MYKHVLFNLQQVWEAWLVPPVYKQIYTTTDLNHTVQNIYC